MKVPESNTTVQQSEVDDLERQYYDQMQEIMRNNPSAVCYDSNMRMIKPFRNYWPHIPAWGKFHGIKD